MPELETNPFVRILHTRQSRARKREEADANGLGALDYPEASWKEMYLTRPAVAMVEISQMVQSSSKSGHLEQVIRINGISMNYLSEEHPLERRLVRFTQSDGIRMHHLRDMDFVSDHGTGLRRW